MAKFTHTITYGCNTTTNGRQMVQSSSLVHCAFFRHGSLFRRTSVFFNIKMIIRDYFYLDSSEMFGDSFAGILYSTENQYSLLSHRKLRDPDSPWKRKLQWFQF